MRTLLAAVSLLALAAPAADARLDRDFAGKGWRTLSLGRGSDAATAVLRTANGKLLVGGFTHSGVGFARLHPSGRLDRRFGRDGRVQIRTRRVVLTVPSLAETGGRRVLAGLAYHPEEAAMGVLRLRADGTRDRSYGNEGIARVDFADVSGAELAEVVRLPGGGVLLVGSVLIEYDWHVALARLDARGRLVAAPVVHGFGDGQPTAAVRLPGNGVAVGIARDEAPREAAVALFTEDGALTRQVSLPRVYLTDLARDGDGVAALLQSTSRWGVRRFTASLEPRPAPAKLPSGGRAEPTSLAVDRRHRAWVGLTGGRVARVRPDGRPDRRFATRGRTMPFTKRYALDTNDILVHPRGGAVAAGLANQHADIREDYGLTRTWIARFAR